MYQYSNMTPRLSGENCKFLVSFCLSIPKRNLGTKGKKQICKFVPKASRPMENTMSKPT